MVQLGWKRVPGQGCLVPPPRQSAKDRETPRKTEPDGRTDRTKLRTKVPMPLHRLCVCASIVSGRVCKGLGGLHVFS